MSRKGDDGLGYEAIADQLRARIESGELAPGDKVPGENGLMETLGVSRDTASKALQILRNLGLTESRQGAPTRVRKFERIVRPASQRLSKEVWGSGRSVQSADVVEGKTKPTGLHVDRVPSDARVAELLGIEAGAAVVVRDRSYVLGAKPVMHAVSYIPADLADGTQIAEEDTGPGGIWKRLDEIGHGPTLFREEVRSRMPKKAEQELLRIERGTPVMEIRRFAAEESGRIVEVNEMVLDSSNYVLEYVIPS
ncbi:GntR family transcriptional regulator [Streptomyces huasconensis]|uniref:GntR family transcriptional regulator n=1 Tax=Streptomyces huasconensis TaxID=1854574 RepID=UPI0036F5205B